MKVKKTILVGHIDAGAPHAQTPRGTPAQPPLRGPSNFDTLPDTAFVRQPQVLELVPFSPATLWRKCKSGDFPSPIKLSERVAAWNAGKIRAWFRSQAESQARAEAPSEVAEDVEAQNQPQAQLKVKVKATVKTQAPGQVML